MIYYKPSVLSITQHILHSLNPKTLHGNNLAKNIENTGNFSVEPPAPASTSPIPISRRLENRRKKTKKNIMSAVQNYTDYANSFSALYAVCLHHI